MALTGIVLSSVSMGDEFQQGNVLVSTDDVVYEVTTSGAVVQSIPTQYPGGYPSTEYARDVTVGANGNLYVYNGTFSPYVSEYDPVNSVWRHLTNPDFNTANNGSYGGIAAFGDRIFATDALGDGGVFEFDFTTEQSVSFAPGTNAIDLTLGLDGALYVLSPGGSPEGRTIDVYDPATYGFLDSISLTSIFGFTGHRSVAVNFNGDLFIADWDGEVHHVGANGELLNTVMPEACTLGGRPIRCSFNDIDISESGQIALGTRFGAVLLSDVSLSSFSVFSIGTRGTFVDFVPQPTVLPIDVRPTKSHNRINLSRKKNLWVSVLGNDRIDINDIDPASLRLGPGSATINRSARIEDTNGDLVDDLRVRFKVSDISISCGDTSLTLSGETTDGRTFTGSDFIETRGCP